MHNLAQAQYARLVNHQSRNWISGRYLLFMFGINVAAIPLWICINKSQTVTLLVIGGVIHLTNCLVILRTLRIGCTNTYGKTTGGWELFALTGITGRQFVGSQWLGVMRFVWKDHALFGVLRFGLAVGIAEYFHFYLCLVPGLDVSSIASLDNALCYISSKLDIWNTQVQPPIPGIPVLLLGASVLLVFSLLEAGLCAAIAVSLSLLHLPSRRFRLGLGIATRFLLAIVGILLWSAILRQTFDLSSTIRSVTYNYYDASHYDPERELELKQIQRVIKHSQIGVLSLSDGGTILAAQFMRPSWGILANLVYGIPSAMVGLLCYGSLIGFFLFAASRLLRRKGFVT